MNKKSEYQLIPLALVLSLGFAAPVYAVDGVIEINQADALAGAITAGDTAGFPVTINEPGSYRLTGNLTVPDANTTAILIASNDVTLDLNGFRISGPGGSGAGDGVGRSGLRRNVAVINGAISNMGDDGVSLESVEYARVERLNVFGNGNDGIVAGPSSTIIGNIASDNADDGIFTETGSTVSDNTVSENGDIGIFTRTGSTVTGNTARNNVGAGIQAGRGSTVIGNTLFSNIGFGLLLQTGFGTTSGYKDNVLTSNNGGNANPQVSGGIEIGTNLCGTNTTCP